MNMKAVRPSPSCTRDKEANCKKVKRIRGFDELSFKQGEIFLVTFMIMKASSLFPLAHKTRKFTARK
jgi:hypothetical protein